MATTKKTASKKTKKTKKVSSAKTKAKPTTESIVESKESTPEEQDARYTWELLGSLLGTPSDEEKTLWHIESPSEELLQLGRQIRSERILTDVRRHLGQIGSWLLAREKSQKSTPLGLSLGYLRVALSEAQTLQQKLSSRTAESRNQKTGAAVQEANLDALWRDAVDLREQLSQGLLVCAADDAKTTAQINEATGKLTDEESLAVALGRLAGLVTASAKETSATFVARRRSSGFSDDTAKQATECARSLRETHTKGKGARVAPSVSQSELDQLDGALLTRMSHWMKIIAAARSRFPDLPHVFPISTASFFRRGDRTPAAPNPTKPTP